MNFYNKILPSVNELIVCKVINHNEATVELSSLEYSGTDPHIFIIHSEITKKKRCHNIKSLLKVNDIDVFEVINVEEDKNIIEVSKKNIQPLEKKEKMTEYQNEVKAVNIFKYIIKLFESGTTFYTDSIQIYETPSILIHKIRNNISLLDKYFDTTQKEKIIGIIDQHYAEKDITIRSDFKLSYYGKEGIDAIKDVLSKAQELSTNDIPIVIKYISSPTYAIFSDVKGKLKNETVNMHQKVCSDIETWIQSYKGMYTFQSLGQSEKKEIDETNSSSSGSDEEIELLE